MLYIVRSLTIVGLMIVLSTCKDENASSKAEIISFKAHQILDKEILAPKNNHQDLQGNILFKNKKYLDHQKVSCIFTYSDEAAGWIGHQEIPNGTATDVSFKRIDKKTYQLSDPLKIIAQDCISEKEYQVVLNVLGNSLIFTKLTKVYSRTGLFSTNEIMGNIVGEKKGYTLEDIHTINPNDIVSPSGSKPNLSLNFLKSGAFTATLVLEHPTSEDVTITKAQFEITKIPPPRLGFTKLSSSCSSGNELNASQILGNITGAKDGLYPQSNQQHSSIRKSHHYRK